MYIIHIVNNLKVGGLQKFTLSLAEESSKRDTKVKVIVLEKTSGIKALTEFGLVEIIQFDCASYMHKLKCVYNYLKHDKPDVVHTHGLTLLFAALSIYTNKNIKFVHTIHNLANIESGKLRRRINKILFKRENVTVVTISDEVEESFNFYYKYTLSKKVYNGCRLTTIYKNSSVENFFESIVKEKKVIVNVGRIDYQKNQKLLIEAFNKLKKSNNICLVILGGPLSNDNKFYNEIRNSNLCLKNIYFLGEVSNVENYLKYSDVFCLSSLFEGLPISLLEAMSFGLTCVSTPAGGSASVINRGAGYVSQGFDVESLADALFLAISEPKNPTSVIELFNSNYSMSICTNNYFRIYEN